MNTIIPNKLSFNLDLNDLPVRASNVDQDTLSLSSKGKPSKRHWGCQRPGTYAGQNIIGYVYINRNPNSMAAVNAAFAKCNRRYKICRNKCGVFQNW